LQAFGRFDVVASTAATRIQVDAHRLKERGTWRRRPTARRQPARTGLIV